MKGLNALIFIGLIPATLLGQDRSFASTNRNVLGSETDLTASLRFVDVDGDGDLDVVLGTGRHWAQANEIYLNNGSGQFTVAYPLGPEKATTYAVPGGDLDGDGDMDIVVANDMAENWVYLNDGKGHFALAWSVGPEVEPTRSAQLSDLDGNGTLDVLVTNRGAANGYYLNDGTGRFGPKHEFGDARGSTIAVAIGDVDGDGDPDLVLANRDGQANRVLLNDGSLNFTESRTFGTGSDETRSVALADLNGDGVLDIVAANIGEPNGVYLGSGDGRFDTGVAFGGADQSYAVSIVDVDRDGDEDLVVANVRARNAVYLNDGTGLHWREVWLGDEEATSYGVETGDLNGDGYPEFGFANSGGLNRIFRNVRAAPGRAPQSTDLVYISNVSRTEAEGRALTTVEDQTAATLERLGEELRGQGLDYSDVVVSNVFLRDTRHFQGMNGIYRTYFQTDPPTRATVRADLLDPDALIQISVVATAAPKQIITPADLKSPALPYSWGIKVGSTLFLSGATSRNPETYQPVTGDVETQTHRVLGNLGLVLNAADMDFDDLVSCRVFLDDPRGYAAMNGAYAETVSEEDPPARATVRAALMNPVFSTEIQCVAEDSPSRRVVRAEGQARRQLPFSPGIDTGDRVYLAGVVGRGTNASEEARAGLASIEATLAAASLEFNDIENIWVYLADIRDRDSVQAVLDEVLGSDAPAPTVVGTRLVGRGGVEIQIIARRD